MVDPAGGRLAGRRAIVTGALGGIGRAIARAFDTTGADLVVDGGLGAGPAMLAPRT